MEDRRMKKIYVKPSINVYEIKQSQILCGSPTDPFEWPYPGAYIPGQPDDKHQLA
jgi:hypothetical protein